MFPDDDRLRLQHMLDAAKRAVRLSAGRGREDLDAEDEPLADALLHLISVIGEAANNVSLGTRFEIGGIRWADVVSMRNRLIHGYFDINLDIVWATVQDNLPSLIQSLEVALVEDEKV